MKHPLLVQRPRSDPWDQPEPDDNALIRQALENPAAFGDIYQRYAVRVYRFIRARTGNDDEASDLTQDVFVRAFRSLPAYQDRGLPFAAWLFRIARNLVTDAYRSRRVQITWDTLPDTLLASSDDDPEQLLIRQERLNRLVQLIRGLDPDKQDLLALRYAAGLTIREISSLVGKSEDAIKQQFSRTLRSLNEQYNDER